MKKVTLAIALAALAMLAGCKKDKETTGTTLTASIEQQSGSGSRTSIHPEGTIAKIHWTDGDKITVNNGTRTETFNLASVLSDHTTGTFTYNGEYTFSGNNIAVYPETATINGSEITVTLPAEKAVEPGISQNPMMGTFSDPEQLTFTSLCGVLGIGLKGDNINITAVEIVSNKAEKLNGTFSCTTDSRVLNVAPVTDEASKKMRLNCTTTLTETTKRFYFPLPVGALAEGFTLNVYNGGEEPIFSTDTDNDISIVLNQVNVMPEVTVAEHAYVNLGLPSGLLWATCNVGANAPENYGDYFAWGETQPKDVYNWNTYQYHDGSNPTKYTGSDGLTTLLPEDDAATANWGNGWRMPTQAEWQELLDNTTMTWTQQGGVNGRLFTASNGNSLFLPAAGFRNNSSLNNAGRNGTYWSSSLDLDNPNHAWYLYFTSSHASMSSGAHPTGRTSCPRELTRSSAFAMHERNVAAVV